MNPSTRAQQGRETPIQLPPAGITILGAGKFGRLAHRRLARRFPDADLTVVDRAEAKLLAVAPSARTRILAEDAIAHLSTERLPPDRWIVPAVPIHVAFIWLLEQLEPNGRVTRLPVPQNVDAQLPHPMRGPGGTVYASYADFLCPDNCPEPEAICTYTRQPRKGRLFETVGGLRVPGYLVHVCRSHQLAPGVGGYTRGQLESLYREVLSNPGNHVIATCCSCHGVLDALSWEKP